MENIILYVILFGLCKWNFVFSASPSITTLLTAQTISETSAIGTSVLTITATDSDGDTITYAVISGSKFVMNGVVLTTSDTFDYENVADRTHNVVIRVKDINGNFVDGSTVITISNADDNVPVFNPTVYTASIAENSASGTSVKDLVCSDADTSTACTISIQSGDDTTAKFSISGTRIVTSANPIDYESLTGHNFVYTLVVVSTSDSVSSATATVYVTITAVNENTPNTFATSPSTISIPESISIGTSVCLVKATETDIEPGGAIQYSIIGGDTNGDFGIDAVTGIIYTAKTIDYETHTSYSLNVRGTDAASSPLAGSSVVTVTITNVNDNTPICSPNYGIVSLPETSTAGTTVHTLSCSDADGDTLSYSIVSGDSDSIFTVSAGVITIAAGKSVDYDTGATTYSLAVQVSDGTYSTTVTVAVTITASNEVTPSFSANPTVNLAEDSSVGTAVYTYSATDSDAAPHAIVSYEITSVTNSGITFFTIDHSSGAIKLAKTLDYESQITFSITVVATDGGGLKGTGTVTVSVTDVNDNTPSCTPNVYALTVAENTAVSSTVISDLQCTDSDSGSNGALVYSLTQNPGSKFSVSAGVVTVAATLDYETTTSYSLQITVSDSASPARSSIVEIEITIANVNEATPVFTSSGLYSITFDENTATATTLVTVSASDTDTGDTIVYGFVSSYTGFVIIPSTGSILLTRSLDYETATTHTLLTTATDGTGTTTATVSITVNDVNEAPTFGTVLYSPTIDENMVSGSSVVQVSANDPDASTNGVITYSITSGDGSSYFAIDPNTGVITTSAVLNYEDKAEFNLVIRAADGASPSLSASCLVNVTVNDLNDNPPIFIPSTFTLIINENVTSSTVIKTLAATDVDSSVTNNNVFEYTLTTNTIPFSVGTTSGQVTTNTALDRETTSRYELVITAIDKGTVTQLSTTYTLTVVLTDDNDNTPVISGTYDTTISEDTPLNTYLFTISASDTDEGDNSRLTYSISTGDSNNDFKIESGVIFTAKTLDRETVAVYNLVIEVSDNGSPSNTASVTATVTILDINDNTPTFTTNFAFTVSEGVAINGNVGTLLATDADDGVNAALTYSIQENWSVETNPFNIDGSTGVISIGSSLDRETLDLHHLLVRVVDGGTPSLSSDLNITVSVSDVNDNAPVFGNSLYSGTVEESVIVGTTVLTVSASDADTGSNAVIAFSIDTAASGGTTANQYFTLSSTTGVVTVKQIIDRETVSAFNFTINAIDNGSPQLTTSVSIYVSVTDINDNNPVFSPTFYDSEISYLVTCSSSITTLTATDADSGDNGEISYYIISSNGINFDDYFEIGSSTGQLKLKSQATSGSKYIMTFGAHDSGSTQRTTTDSATVRVDTYDPGTTVIVFYMSIGLSTFTGLESTFLTQLTSVYRETYSTSQAKRWCITDETSSIKVYVYVVKDDTADAENEIGNAKTFVSSTIARDIVASSTGTPGSTITGNTWIQFSITSVLLYNVTVNSTTTSSTDTAWIESTTGIAVISAASAGFLILIVIAVCITITVCKKDNSRSSSKVNVTDEVSGVTSAKSIKSKSFSARKDGDEKVIVASARSVKTTIENIDRDELKSAVLYQDPAHRSNRQKTPNFVRTPLQNKLKELDNEYESKKFSYPDFFVEKRQPSPVVSVSPLPYKVDTEKYNTELVNKPRVFNSFGTESLNVKSSNLIKESFENEEYPRFDGRAVDPATGKLYEYNTKTSERRWVTSKNSDIIHQTKF